MKILVCSDGHKQAEQALRFITNTAAACDAEVTVLGIIEHPGDETTLHDTLRKQVQILRDKKVAVELVTRAGQPLDQIQKQTQDNAFDLVVIGAERKSDGPFAMSAKAYHLIKSVEPPVLVVVGQRPDLRRILICSGGETYIDHAVQLAGVLAAKSRLQVTLLHVMAEPPVIYADLIEREENARLIIESNTALGRNLRSEKEALAKVGVDAEIKLRHGLVVPEILHELDAGDFDVVVTGSSRASGPLQTYIMGDVTSEIVNRAERPVLVVRGGAAHPRGFFGRLAQLFTGSIPEKNSPH